MVCLLISIEGIAQLERKLETENEPEDLVFHAPRHINLYTVEPLDKNTLHFAIMHTFGTLDNGGRNLFGLDNGANIRFSLEYGASDKFSVGFGRSGMDKVYDVFARYHLLQQTRNDVMPVSVSFMVNAAANTSDYSFLPEPRPVFQDRLSYAGQIMIARKFSDAFSFQLSPMVAWFVNPDPIFRIETTDNLYLALGLSGKYKITGKSSLTLQYIPNLNNELRNNLGIGIDIEAGGHVFQMYFVTSQALNEQYLIAGGNGIPGEQFRLGFNVNRIFNLKK